MRHTINEADLDEWLHRPQWQNYASSGAIKSHKRLEVDRGEMFRVTVSGEVVFLGTDRAAAVAAYNDAP